MKKYYSLSEAAELVGKSKETLRRWDNDGILNAVREPVSNYRVYRKEDIHNLMIVRKDTPTHVQCALLS